MTAAVVTLALLAVVAAGALTGLTSILHGASRRATHALESVRLAEEVQRDLLLHDRLRDAAAREQIATALRERLVVARSQIAAAPQREALDVADRKVRDYLAASDASDSAPGTDGVRLAAKHGEAFDALQRLVAVELDEVRDARATAHRYDELGDLIGTGIAGVVILASGLVVWWLHARALRPLGGLARTMRSFGRGKLDERASEEGPAEVAEMARRFNEMASAIARQRKERQTFIAGVVHDLRNPLAVLRLSTDVVNGGVELPRARLMKVLGAVGRQVGRLERMVSDLLDSVSIEAGTLRLRLEEHDVALEVVELYATTSAAHSIDVQVPDEPVVLRCDGMRLEQVLSNLVSNAIKYSPAGGPVTVQVRADRGMVVFRVRDHGVGMSAEDAETAFEPFRRSAGMRDAVPGSGLGLYVVRRLVEAHGGRIMLSTAPGEGSTLEVTLPADGQGVSAGGDQNPSLLPTNTPYTTARSSTTRSVSCSRA
jgi:signal transduction histidine kinase